MVGHRKADVLRYFDAGPSDKNQLFFLAATAATGHLNGQHTQFSNVIVTGDGPGEQLAMAGHCPASISLKAKSGVEAMNNSTDTKYNPIIIQLFHVYFM